jgi:hypothetical protein
MAFCQSSQVRRFGMVVLNYNELGRISDNDTPR